MPASPTRRDWASLLLELARQLDNGRVYDRDLPKLAVALNAVLEAYRRRPSVQSRWTGLSPFAQGGHVGWQSALSEPGWGVAGIGWMRPQVLAGRRLRAWRWRLFLIGLVS
jgi:hypothetical protein